MKNKMLFYVFKYLSSAIMLSLFVALAFLSQRVNGQSEAKEIRQPQTELSSLIRKAEQDQYNVRRVEFSGNSYIRDRVLRRKTIKQLNEGDIFTRRNLYQSLIDLSKLKVIYEVRLEDVEVRLDEDNKIIDIVFNVRQRRQSKQAENFSDYGDSQQINGREAKTASL